MLRRPLSRTLPLRQFATSPSIWHPRGPLTTDVQHKEPLTNPTPPLLTKLEETHPNPLPTESEATSSPNVHDAGPRGSVLPYNIELVKQHLQEWTTQASVILRNRADDFTAATKRNFAHLGWQLNHVTGYEEIEALKRGVVDQEHRIGSARQAARKAKVAFEEAVIQRSNSQREVNDLLQRKSTWTDSDVGRFTSLVRQDHLYEQEELRAKVAVEETEEAVEREFSQLMRKILARYHEEQVWSDKIRSASTYGSLAALGLNMLVFIIAIVAVEPWKRRRLAQTFERKIEELSSENEARLTASMAMFGQQFAEQRLLLEDIKEEAARKPEFKPPITQPAEKEPESTEGTVEPGALLVIWSWTPSRQHLEIAAVGASAFAIGILGTMILGR